MSLPRNRPRRVSAIASLVRETLSAWWGGPALRMGAALAYYTVFSLAPLLVVSVAVVGVISDETAVRRHLVEHLSALMGSDGAAAVETMMKRAAHPEESAGWAALLAIATLLFGATSAFAQLKRALDEIFGPPDNAPKGGLPALVRSRLLALGMILLLGFLLLVSLIVAALVSTLDELAGGRWHAWGSTLAVLNFLVSTGLATLLFAGIFRLLPARDVRWRDAWLGGLVTALLFAVGKWAIGLYLGNAAIGSMYGAAGSLVVVMVWVYYSSQILFLGAEFTRIHARRADAAPGAPPGGRRPHPG